MNLSAMRWLESATDWGPWPAFYHTTTGTTLEVGEKWAKKERVVDGERRVVGRERGREREGEREGERERKREREAETKGGEGERVRAAIRDLYRRET